ncbi:hypothetical protein ACI65C_013628 [Semiaphis heraclei]
MGLSQPSVSRCISEVVAALNLPEIFNAWVKFPKNINELTNIRKGCLLRDRTLHYKPEKASSIINACVVLHNMCITNNVPMPDDPNIEELDNLGCPKYTKEQLAHAIIMITQRRH